MGSKQTKFEGSYLPEFPQQPPHQPITVQTDFGDDLDDLQDPRSPHICRTPLNEIIQKKDQQVATIPAISTEQPLGLLRKRFFKGFSYSLNDPRSPSVLLNRTPLVFDETVNLDDTFSDLFVDTKVPPILENTKVPPADTVEDEQPKEEEQKTDGETIQTPKITKTNPQEITMERDPRSPSIGVDRTPIILNDDDAPDEDDMIETILSTLSLNQPQQKPSNKPLDRVRNKKSATSKPSLSKMSIYTDRENLTTPSKATQGEFMDSPSPVTASIKRTPLSCLKNNPQFKSKSVDVSAKTMKPRLPLTSFDDSLHKITPVKKILRYSNMENIENSFEF